MFSLSLERNFNKVQLIPLCFPLALFSLTHPRLCERYVRECRKDEQLDEGLKMHINA